MPPRGPVESALGLFSLGIWGLAVGIRVLVLSRLPAWHPGLPEGGCYFSNALTIFVECRGTSADRLFGQVLNFAYYWTDGIVWMAAFFWPVLLLWLLSIYFVLRFVTSRPAAA